MMGDVRPPEGMICLTGCCWCGTKATAINRDVPITGFAGPLERVELPGPAKARPCGHEVEGVLEVVDSDRKIYAMATFVPGTQPPHMHPAPVPRG